MKYDYDVAVIGGGAAGLVAATGASFFKVKTALIEKNKLGGDCTWYGCIPSKALLKSAQVFSLIKRSKDFGIASNDAAGFDTSFVLKHVREVVAKISTHHPPEVFEKRGIKVLFGSPVFLDGNAIELNGARISSKKFIICTGSHPIVPPIEGLSNSAYLTNENVFDLESVPRSLIVLGGGPIGVELAQAFSKLGAKVCIVEMFERLLIREEPEISAALQQELLKGGAEIFTGYKAIRVLQSSEGVEVIIEDKNKNQVKLEAQKLLIAVGRNANVTGLGLEKTGVKYSNKGIEVNAGLRTAAKNIFACGDVVGPYQFSHMAEYQAIIACTNALLPFRRKVDYSSVPWCTFTEPEIARVGLTEIEARKIYGKAKVYRSEYSENDRAVTDIEEAGFAKVVCDARGRILGAHIIGAKACELIHEYVLAKTAGINLKKISSTIHIYPTLSQLVKKNADKHYLDILFQPRRLLLFVRRITDSTS